MNQKVILSAFACDPSKGSEPNNGWQWAIGLSKCNIEVDCFTRIIGKASIERMNIPDNLTFHYIKLPLFLESLYSSSSAGMYIYYIIWQYLVYRKAKTLHRLHPFHLAHHVTWGSIQMGSFMYKLKIPFIFGPAGGGQSAPIAFKKYFGRFWSSEKKRELISFLLQKWNPAYRKMIKKADAILVSNPETFELVRRHGASKVYYSLDATLPEDFYPLEKRKMGSAPGFKVLWLGRFMPRKGLMLAIDVMRELKDFPDIKLTIVGDGEIGRRQEAQEKVAEYGLEHTIEFTGMVPFNEVCEYYKSHDIFLCTSLRDSGPVQLVEAMAYSLPIVALNIHGQAYIVNDERGIKCDCSSPEIAVKSLKDAILNLYLDDQKRYKMGACGYEFALKQNWSNKISDVMGKYYPKLEL